MVTAKKVDFGSNLESSLLSKTLCYSQDGEGEGERREGGKETESNSLSLYIYIIL